MTTPEIVSGGIPIEYSLGDEGAAKEMAGAVDAVLGLAQDDWGLGPPKDCRLYVMTSWRDFFFQAAPGLWIVPVALGYPLWSGRARRTWPYSAGWTVRFGRRVAIGIKPPRLLDVSDKTVGMYIFEPETDTIAKIRHVTCHELVHAASAHLRLPAWLNEGLAAISVDRFVGRPTIRVDSLGLLQRMRPKAPPPSYRAQVRLQGELLAYHAVRGYWIVRLLEEAWPGFVRSFLEERQSHRAIERLLAGRMGLPIPRLWQEIDEIVVTHFRGQQETA